ncbi:SDR family NAD(P)-dependent oxidoreductase [Bacillus sp. FJAT-45350]|uniref:SDR family NAD(P)-dependent oxidoreductase n=1 Tax=Bacillus sp. FJAT-45350 TaxID=2011014 RepID=UPI000BB8C16E|nr:SDR family NAD(P)-dependent oxidoreductase [Bacillus sp. FJAT-45350]
MEKALVVGASGGIGYALVCELASRGVEVVAFARNKEKLKKLFNNKSNVSIYSGDALNETDLIKSSEGVEVIFHALNFPYQEWEEKHPKCIKNMIRTAKAQQAKIALVDNIYAYGKNPGVLVTEETRKTPHTKKGKIRLEMENRLKESGIPSLIVHMPDVYGPNAENTMLHETLKNVIRNKNSNFIGHINIAREYLYTFDGAKGMVELAFREEAYNQNWNIPSSHPITGDKLLALLREEIGYQKSLRVVSKSMIRFLGIVSPSMKEMVEMMYLTEEPIILSGDKYEKEITTLPRTPYKQGIKETVDWMKQ